MGGVAGRMDHTLAQLEDQGLAEHVRQLPTECQVMVASYLGFVISNTGSGMAQSHQHQHQHQHTPAANPSVPPHDGSSPFLKLPVEIRRIVLRGFLLFEDIIIQPADLSRRSFTCDLLVLNRQLMEEISTILYEERTFGVHVYEGVHSGGIKFLNSGLQRLQHKDNFQVYRFKRFNDDDDFGLKRIKRLVIFVHPCSDKRTTTGRHDPIYTHFMMLALVKLLEVQFAKREITYLKIKLLEPKPASRAALFAALTSRRAIMQSEDYWWNPVTKSPRATSVHALSNVELILRPFYRLYRVHNAEMELPRSMDSNKPTQQFKAHLISAMTSKGGEMICDDELDHKIEAARDSLDEWLFKLKFGNGGGVPDKDVWLADEIVNTDFPENDVGADMTDADALLAQQLMDEDELEANGGGNFYNSYKGKSNQAASLVNREGKETSTPNPYEQKIRKSIEVICAADVDHQRIATHINAGPSSDPGTSIQAVSETFTNREDRCLHRHNLRRTRSNNNIYNTNPANSSGRRIWRAASATDAPTDPAPADQGYTYAETASETTTTKNASGEDGGEVVRY